MAMSIVQEVAKIAGAASGGKSNDVMLKIVTGLRYSSEIARMLNGITFMFNPSWRSSDYDRQTLPIAFYFVKGWQEISQNNISQKQMLFYNSSMAGGATAGGLLDVVADNIVTQPREWRMEVLVPQDPLAYLDQYQLDPYTIANAMEFVFSGGGSKGLAGASKWILSGVTVLRILFAALSVDLSVSGLMNMMLSGGRTTINKASVDALRASRTVVKMKEFGGWTFRYVAVKSVELRKSGEVEDFYEGAITVQEMPVMTLAKGGSSVLSKARALQSLVGDVMDKKAIALAAALASGGGITEGGK